MALYYVLYCVSVCLRLIRHCSMPQKPTDELGRAYVNFMRVSLDQIRQKVGDEIYVLTIYEVSPSYS